MSFLLYPVHSALYLFEKLLFELNWLVIACYVPGNDKRFIFDYERHSFKFTDYYVPNNNVQFPNDKPFLQYSALQSKSETPVLLSKKVQLTSANVAMKKNTLKMPFKFPWLHKMI